MARSLTRSGFPRLLWANLCCALVAVALAGCGGGAETTAGSDPGANRYFGDHPGQAATKAALRLPDCRMLQRAVDKREGVRTGRESEPSPPSSRCLLSGHGLHVSVYLDAGEAARQRYYKRMVEQVQFYGADPAKTPRAVSGVGDRSAHEHTASWIPGYSTLYAVRDNRWLTVTYFAPRLSQETSRARAAALARIAFRLTAPREAASPASASPARR